MLKKMMLLALSAAALVAFAIPAAASATVTLTENEEPLPVPSDVTATSTNLVTTTAGGTLECEKVTLHLRLLANGIDHVVLQQLGEATTTNCKLNIVVAKLDALITDGTLGVGENSEITIDTQGTGVTTAHFGADVPEAGANCSQDGTVHVTATNGTDILDVGPSELTASGGTACKNGTIEGTFTLETSDGTPIDIDADN